MPVYNNNTVSLFTMLTYTMKGKWNPVMLLIVSGNVIQLKKFFLDSIAEGMLNLYIRKYN